MHKTSILLQKKALFFFLGFIKIENAIDLWNYDCLFTNINVMISTNFINPLSKKKQILSTIQFLS